MDSFTSPVGPLYGTRRRRGGHPAAPCADDGLISRVRAFPWAVCGLALLIGAGTAVGAAGVAGLVTGLTLLFTGRSDGPSGSSPALLLAPVLGGLIAGLLLHSVTPGSSGIPELQRNLKRGVRIDPAGPVARALAAASTVGSGGSLGTAGPVLHLSAALGSVLHSAGTRMGTAIAAHHRLLTVCGAAGSITAVFHAPLAGMLFTVELLGAQGAVALAATALATAAAATTTHLLLGPTPLLALLPAPPPPPAAYALFAVLGLLAGAAAACLHHLLTVIRRGCAAAWRACRVPTWLRPACGGLVLGALLLALPWIYGSGLTVIGPAAHGRYAVELLLLLLLGKTLATCLTIGTGGCGGLLAPLLSLGGLLGSLCGQTAAGVFGQGVTGSPAHYAVAGTAALVAGALRAPATAALLALELYGRYSLALPTAVAALTAAFTTRALFPAPRRRQWRRA
ncbi:chloride channel protein [Streptomyces halobius]|uniref:Chloride channel protein n=1 Tax=Streptomyces halobius TaxID=2879846 RepID=A0ABY4M6E3_9ACTN|nr:chloride channel protein [Streptomyces halobius]UQA92399.1 chloride channel protein [Streptomyces halobius]